MSYQSRNSFLVQIMFNIPPTDFFAGLRFIKFLFFPLNLEQLYSTSHESPFLTALFFISFFFVISTVAIGILLFVKRQTELFIQQSRNFYKKSEILVRDYYFTDNHKVDFFGRSSVVTSMGGPYASCLITPVELFSDASFLRFNTFVNLTKDKELNAVPILWSHMEQPFIIIYDKIIDPSGKVFPTLSKYLSNKKLGRKDKENVLLTLSKSLSTLHKLEDKSGEKLYHGFMLPRSFYLTIDSYHAIKRFQLGDAGMAFSIGPEKMFQRIQNLKKGHLLIEKHCAQELISQLTLLAPEQKDAKRLHEVSTASDFFTFAAVAITLFTGRKFSKPSDVEWLLVPEKWRAFLFSCMEDRIENRPSAFSDIENWVTDQELSLSFFKNSVLHNESSYSKNTEYEHSTVLPHLLQCLKNQVNSNIESSELQENVERYLNAGFKAMAVSQWNEAKKHFLMVLKMSPSHSQAHANLAIIYYELNDLKNAEEHYEKAKVGVS